MKASLILFFVIFIFSSIVNAGFTKNKEDSNRFIYQRIGFPEKEVVINGFTFVENIAVHSDNALLASNDLAAIDQPLEIEIEHVQAIQVFNSSQYPYNQLIAFLVRTRDGRILLHIQIAKLVAMVEANPINFLFASLKSTRAYMLDGSTTSNVQAAFDFGHARIAQSSAQVVGSSESSVAFIWSTIQLQETMFNGQQLSIPGFITFEYEIIDESNYREMRLTNGSS